MVHSKYWILRSVARALNSGDLLSSSADCLRHHRPPRGIYRGLCVLHFDTCKQFLRLTSTELETEKSVPFFSSHLTARGCWEHFVSSYFLFPLRTYTAAPEIPDDHRNNSFPFALGERERESREHNAGKAAIFHSILAQSEEERKEGV